MEAVLLNDQKLCDFKCAELSKVQKKRPLSVLVVCCFAGLVFWPGCSREHYKTEADEEVYGILDAKWGEGLGSKVNYRISDVTAGPNDLSPSYTLPASGMLCLADTVALATANNRNYQTQKERLYLTALSLTGQRHSFARQWFGTIDAGYTRNSADESVDYDVGLGLSQLLANGVSIGADIAIDWARFLTGDPRTSLSSVLSARVVAPL